MKWVKSFIFYLKKPISFMNLGIHLQISTASGTAGKCRCGSLTEKIIRSVNTYRFKDTMKAYFC